MVSIINLASVAAIETMVGVPVHPLRFRANLYVAGWPAWHEFSLLGREIAIGAARLKVTKRIARCAAINVDPDTGMRDLAIPATLMRDASITRIAASTRRGDRAGGEIAPGDAGHYQSVNASGRATCSSGLRSAATPQRHMTAAAPIISAAPSR